MRLSSKTDHCNVHAACVTAHPLSLRAGHTAVLFHVFLCDLFKMMFSYLSPSLSVKSWYSLIFVCGKRSSCVRCFQPLQLSCHKVSSLDMRTCLSFLNSCMSSVHFLWLSPSQNLSHPSFLCTEIVSHFFIVTAAFSSPVKAGTRNFFKATFKF